MWSLAFESLELFDSQLFVLCDRRHWQSALVLGSVVQHGERFGQLIYAQFRQAASAASAMGALSQSL